MPDEATTFLTFDEAATIVGRFPYPVGAVAGEYLKRKELRGRPPAALDDAEAGQEPEEAPDEAVFAWGMRQLYSLVAKFVTIVLLADYERDPTDPGLNGRIYDSLSGATLEHQWWAIALGQSDDKGRLQQTGIVDAFLDAGKKPFVGEFDDWRTDHPDRVAVTQAIRELQSFRNKVAHSIETVTPDIVDKAERNLDTLVTKLAFIGDYALVCRTTDGVVYASADNGTRIGAHADPGLVELISEDDAGKCFVAADGGRRVLCVHPWIAFSPSGVPLSLPPWIAETVESSEELERELRATVLDADSPIVDRNAASSAWVLSYGSGQRASARSLEDEQRLACPVCDPTRARMEELEARAKRAAEADIFDFGPLVEEYVKKAGFQGRDGDLAALRAFGREGEGYGLMAGVAGQGKTALVAKLFDELRATPDPDVVWVWHFCARVEKRDDGRRFMRSVLAQLSDAIDGFPASEWKGLQAQEMRERFAEVLGAAATKAGDHGRRVALFVDAIDEGTGSGDFSIINCLPARLPGGVAGLVTVRADDDGTPLVDLAASGLRATALDRSPLRPLDKEEVAAVLLSLLPAGKEAVLSAEVEEHVYTVTKGNPLFLRAIADGIREGDIVPDELSTYPATLNDYFDMVWDAFPTERDLLAQRFLCYVGILDDLAWDELLAPLLEEDAEGIEAVRAAPAVGKWLQVRDTGTGETYTTFHGLFGSYIRDLAMRPDEYRALNGRLADWAKEWPTMGHGTQLRRYAVRKLPRHLLQAERWDDLFATLTDFTFLETKAAEAGYVEEEEGRRSYLGPQELVDDFREALEVWPSDEEAAPLGRDATPPAPDELPVSGDDEHPEVEEPPASSEGAPLSYQRTCVRCFEAFETTDPDETVCPRCAS